MSEWISVDDRLPENDAICLVCGKKGGMRVARAYVSKHHSWWTVVGTGKYFTATHWMPLPEAPKEANVAAFKQLMRDNDPKEKEDDL